MNTQNDVEFEALKKLMEGQQAEMARLLEKVVHLEEMVAQIQCDGRSPAFPEARGKAGSPGAGIRGYPPHNTGGPMPRGSKEKYTAKQKRQAKHIAAGYEKHGVPVRMAEARAWATVNEIHHGGEKPGGSGYGRPENHGPMRKGGKRGGKRLGMQHGRTG